MCRRKIEMTFSQIFEAQLKQHEYDSKGSDKLIDLVQAETGKTPLQQDHQI